MNFSYLGKGIAQLLTTELGAQTNVIIKDFHDESLGHLLDQHNQLVMANLSDNQIWTQMNQHLQHAIQKWGKYINRTETLIKQQNTAPEKEEDADVMQQQAGQLDDVEMGQEQGEGEKEEEEENKSGSDKNLEMEGEDVGLYGQLLDEENEEKYDNEQDEEGEDQDMYGIDSKFREDNDDGVQNENFEHFREIDMQNADDVEQKQANIQPVDKIGELQQKLFNRKDWRLKGQISSKQRPLNSLVENPLQFNLGLRFQQQGSENENSQLEDCIKRRVLDDMFDDRSRLEVMPGFREHFTNLPEVSRQKNKQSLGELYEADFANSLGLNNNKEDKDKKEIMDLFKELNYKLDRLSNFNFVPKPVTESKATSQPYILRQQTIPITGSEGKTAEQNVGRVQLKAQKQEGPQRLKTKRIQRQRRKQHEAKRMKRSIEYGGMSKVQLEAKKKIDKTRKDKTTKYSQSGQFFRKFQENISSKEKSKANPNINKLKI